MQDKYPIIVYGEDGTHIRDLLLDFIEKFWPVVVMILLVFVIGLIGILCYNFIDETKQESEAAAILYCCDETYYIDSYTIKGDEIFAVDVKGIEIILPKDRTVIKNKGE